MPRNQTVFPRKKIATKVKHRVLENCLNAWGGIIITSNRGRPVRLAFVDTCCGSGLYASDEADDAAEYDIGSALIGLEVLAGLLHYGKTAKSAVAAKALFINDNVEELGTLRGAIESNDLTAVPFETIPDRLQDVVLTVKQFCANHFAFILIDPYGPSAIPFSVVSELVTLSHTDCLINFPYYSIHKWSGWLGSGREESRLRSVDALLNGSEWRDIARRLSGDPLALEAAILNHYMQQLSRQGVGVFALRMSFEDRDRTMYHLVFTSKNTAGLAAAKKELQGGDAYQAALKTELRAAKQHQGLLDFMSGEDTIDDPVDVDKLADSINAYFIGASPTLDEVIRFGLFQPNVLENHVHKAITKLKRTRGIKITGTRYRDRLYFSPAS
jgi:three-Cys-motif partner protein